MVFGLYNYLIEFIYKSIFSYIIMKKYTSIDYFENEKYRIKKKQNLKIRYRFYLREENDILYVTRYDKKIGWDNEFNLKVFNKVSNKVYDLNVGKSNSFEKKINLDKIVSVNHYENKFYKLYTISEFNDLFKINYDEIGKNLSLKRIDSNEGWDQNLLIEYYEINTQKIKHFYFGPSKNPEKSMIVDFSKLDYADINNFWENENFKIKIKPNIEYDKFKIKFFEESNTVYVKRTDVNEGWGLNLVLKFKNKKYNEKFLIYVGKNENNEIFKKISTYLPKIYVGISTIPSRANSNIFLKNLKDFIKNQVIKIDKIFITIPKKYNRFNEIVKEETIKNLTEIENLEILNIDKDYGPSSKYLGPLINKYEVLKNNLLVIIDDDRLYNKNLIRNLLMGYNSFPDCQFYTGLWSYFFNKEYKNMNNEFIEMYIKKEQNNVDIKYGSGVGGFFGFGMFINEFESFIKYNLKVMSLIKDSIYHDEGIILGYLKYLRKNILFIKHVGCLDFKGESPDALCESKLCDRKRIEKEILYITNLQKLL